MAAVGLPVVGWFVSPIISKVLDHSILHFTERRRLEKGVQEEIDHLGKVLQSIKAVLEDAENTQSDNSGVLSWLGELKEVLYDVEDLLDQHAVDFALKKEKETETPTETSWTAQVSGRFSTIFARQESSLDISVAKQMKLIKERLDEISRRGHELGLREMATSVSTGQKSSSRELWQSRETTSFLADDTTVIGRANEKSVIKNILLSDDGGKKLLVLPIVGMGGVGKTTLSRLVFNDKDVEAFFESRIVWVCIGMSQDLDIRRIMIEIIDSITAGKKTHQDYGRWSLELLQKTLVKEIKEHRRFMLVLDDAWDTNVGNWDILLQPFKASGVTCRIMVTTRNLKVANAIPWDKAEHLTLDLLKEEDMWSIFERCTFGVDIAHVNPELQAVGRHIIRRLKGLPLAARVVSGILKGNKNIRFWRRISESRLLEVEHDENYMLPILMLSYNSLPVLLKQCFSYFSLFPKDARFQNPLFFRNISYHWMAHKIIQKQDVRDLEDVGIKLADDLLKRSLLQYTQDDRITIHDLVHDLAVMVTKDEFIRGSDDTIRELPKKLRHISFFPENSAFVGKSINMLWELKECKTLRTLIFRQYYLVIVNSTYLLDGWFNSFIFLRVLSLENCDITLLPDSIGNLKLLSFLDLDLPKLRNLPENISRLRNLQVLLLHYCIGLSRLPNSLTRLVNLVCLSTHENLEPFSNIGSLTNLQNLATFQVKRQHGHKVTELGNLNGLCGNLHILHLEDVEGKKEAQQAHLNKKDGLEWLKLSWSGTASGGQEKMQAEVLEGLCPNTNLKKLSIIGYMGSYLPNWFDSKYLPFLEYIELRDCLRLNIFQSSVGNLKNLEIYNCPELRVIPLFPQTLEHCILSNVGVTPLMLSPLASELLPSLRRLSVESCPYVDDSLNILLQCSMPSLKSLSISDYIYPLGVLSHLTSLSELKLCNCSEEVIIDAQSLISLREVEIWECPHATVRGQCSESTQCSSLRQLLIKRCPLLLKSLCQSRVLLPSLKKLEINEDGLDEFILYECINSVAALEELIMRQCPNIRSISEEVMHKLVLLRTCEISWCGGLVDLDLQALGSLERLRLMYCPNLVFRRPQSSSKLLLKELDLRWLSAEQVGGLFSILANSTSVERIILNSNSEGLVLPLEYPSLGSLEELYILSCRGVMSLPVLKSLETLVINDCPDLIMRESPSEPFPSLKQLWILGCNIQQLTHLILLATRSPLRTLCIGRCEELIRFDGDLELPFLSLTTLQWLYINGCEHLQELPADLRGSKALLYMILSDCPRMSSLPEEGLPTSLREIIIQKCPLLEERYSPEKEGNLHWQRISHVPEVRFLSDEEDLQSLIDKMALFVPT